MACNPTSMLNFASVGSIFNLPFGTVRIDSPSPAPESIQKLFDLLSIAQFVALQLSRRGLRQFGEKFYPTGTLVAA